MTAKPSTWRPTRAEIDLSAIADNTRCLTAHVAPSAMCAVVKADGYGHGAVESALAALRGGAAWLAVALVEEGVELRQSGIDVPILVLSEPPFGSGGDLVEHRLTASVYSHTKIELLAAAAAAARGVIDVHLKVDTGMHRVGAQPDEVVDLAADISTRPQLRHTGTFTHLAVADAPDDPYTSTQLDAFDAVLFELRSEGYDPGIVHAANSAGAIAHPRARYDMVRCGIAIYGQDPDPGCRACDFGVALTPALRLVSEVSHVKVLPAGERLSYGLRYRLAQDSVIATVPIGYADGVPRRLSSAGGEVLIGGRRWPIAGRVTIDQVLIDCGPPPITPPIARDDTTPITPPITPPITMVSTAADSPSTMPRVGDPVVFLGGQNDGFVSAWEWAMCLDTIAYEVTCGISGRVPRRYWRRESEREL